MTLRWPKSGHDNLLFRIEVQWYPIRENRDGSRDYKIALIV